MGVSRWTEWRTRLDAARAGLIRDWDLPDPEARGYGRGPVWVLERVAAKKQEEASRAEPRRRARTRAREESRDATRATVVEPFRSTPRRR